MSNTAAGEVVWTPSNAAPNFSTSKVLVNGRTYWMQRRDFDGLVIKLSKRERANACGVYFQPMNIKGAAARKVLKALELKGGEL